MDPAANKLKEFPKLVSTIEYLNSLLKKNLSATRFKPEDGLTKIIKPDAADTIGQQESQFLLQWAKSRLPMHTSILKSNDREPVFSDLIVDLLTYMQKPAPPQPPGPTPSPTSTSTSSAPSSSTPSSSITPAALAALQNPARKAPTPPGAKTGSPDASPKPSGLQSSPFASKFGPGGGGASPPVRAAQPQAGAGAGAGAAKKPPVDLEDELRAKGKAADLDPSKGGGQHSRTLGGLIQQRMTEDGTMHIGGGEDEDDGDDDFVPPVQDEPDDENDMVYMSNDGRINAKAVLGGKMNNMTISNYSQVTAGGIPGYKKRK